MPYLGKSPSQGVRTRFQFTPNAGTTSISGADANGLTLSFTDGNYVDVYLNGVMLKAGVDYNTNTANTIAGLSATVASDVVDIVVYDTFSVFGGTLEGNVKVNNGTFNVTGAVDFDSTLNVDGVVTADGLTVDGNAQINGDITVFDGTGDPFIKLQTNEQQTVLRIDNDASDIFQIRDTTNSANRLAISTGGDISFYEDTGSNVKFFFDASEESLVIGASSTATVFEATGSKNDQWAGKFTNTNSGGYGVLAVTDGSTANEKAFEVRKNTSDTAMLIQGDGNVGIGTTSPQQLLHVSANNPGGKIRLEMGQSGVANGDVTGEIQFYHNDSSGAGVNADIKGICTSAIGAGALTFGTGTTSTTERMRIDSSGRVGIGGTPNTNWRDDIANQEVLMLGTEATFYSDGGLTTELFNNAFVNDNDDFKNISTRGASRYFQYSGAHKWFTAASASAGTTITSEIQTTPKMTLDISGNLLVGKTSQNGTGVGIELEADGTFYVGKTGDVATFNRTTSVDGTIIDFKKQGSPVGNIGAIGGDVFIASSPSGHKGLRFANGVIFPVTNSGANSDNETDLGVDGARFKDLFLSGGAYIGGTASANYLDDYEEGTWTPNPYGSTTAGTYHNYARAGRYIKVGDMVYISGYIYGTISGAAGEARVGGLPFQKDSNDQGLATVQWNNCPFDTIASDEHHPVGLVYTDYLFVRASDRVAQGAYHTCVWNNSTISYYRFSATYREA